MLPSWRDRLYLGLGPQRVELAHVGRGLRPRVGACRMAPCGTGGWQDALAEVLQPVVWRQAAATVVLSNHWLRYQLVPWNAALTREEEVAALVRHCFGEVYGSAADGWTLRWHSDGPGQPWVACGVDQALLDELAALLAGAGIRLDSVQPYLMASFNRWRGEFGGGRQWFVLAESGRATVCRIEGGGWRSITSHRIEPSWQESLPLILQRESLLAGESADQPQVLLSAPKGLAEANNVRRLEAAPPPGVAAAEAERFAMALAGVT